MNFEYSIWHDFSHLPATTLFAFAFRIVLAQTLHIDRPTLMLQDSQATLDHDVLEDASRWDIDGAAFRCNDDDRA